MSADTHPPSKWPNVPACYGWLTLDARGQWRLGADGTEIVRHAGLATFLNRNYVATEQGEWFVQNGPQRAYVTLARAPYIARLAEADEWQTHTGRAVRQIAEALVDQEGNVYLVCEHGLVGIDDRDLPALLNSPEGGDDAIGTVAVTLGNRRLPLVSIDADTLPARFGFVRQPRAL
jgi:hypothetical protein